MPSVLRRSLEPTSDVSREGNFGTGGSLSNLQFVVCFLLSVSSVFSQRMA